MSTHAAREVQTDAQVDSKDTPAEEQVTAAAPAAAAPAVSALKAAILEYKEKVLLNGDIFKISIYEELMNHLKQESLGATTTKAIELTHSGCLLNQRQDVVTYRPCADPICSRIINASFAITLFPQLSLQNHGPMEENVIKNATTFLESWKHIIETVCSGPDDFEVSMLPLETFYLFPAKIQAYLAAFHTWKKKDEVGVVARIKECLAAVYNAMKYGDSIDTEDKSRKAVHDELNVQFTRLRKQLRVLAGDKGLDDFDRDYHCGKYNILKNPDADIFQDTSDPMYNGVERFRINQKLVHDILIDPNFRYSMRSLVECQSSELAAFVKQSFTHAFYEEIIQDLQSEPQQFKRVKRLVDELVRGFLFITPTDEKEKVSDLIPVENLSATLSTIYGVRVFCSGVVRAIEMNINAREKEAFNRDWAEIKTTLDAGYSAHSIVCALKLFNATMNKMRVHAANRTLKNIKPLIELHGIAYEKEHAELRKKADANYLERAQKWINTAVYRFAFANKASEEIFGKPCDNHALIQIRDGNADAQHSVHCYAMGSLMFMYEVTQDTLPESLKLDYYPLMHIRKRIDFGVTVGGIVSGVRYIFKCMKNDGCTTDPERFDQAYECITSFLLSKSMDYNCHKFERHDEWILKDLRAELEAQQYFSPTDLDAIEKFVVPYINKGSIRVRVSHHVFKLTVLYLKDPSVIGNIETLFHNAESAEMMKRVASCVEQVNPSFTFKVLKRITDVNWSVYGDKLYKPIFKKAVERLQDTDKEEGDDHAVAAADAMAKVEAKNKEVNASLPLPPVEEAENEPAGDEQIKKEKDIHELATDVALADLAAIVMQGSVEEELQNDFDPLSGKMAEVD